MFGHRFTDFRSLYLTNFPCLLSVQKSKENFSMHSKEIGDKVLELNLKPSISIPFENDFSQLQNPVSEMVFFRSEERQTQNR